jgi:hypothetical protein
MATHTLYYGKRADETTLLIDTAREPGQFANAAMQGLSLMVCSKPLRNSTSLASTVNVTGRCS